MLELELDHITDKIKQKNIKYDAIIGIKTGGAIISGYLSEKLKIPNYKIKITTIANNCNKQISGTILTHIDKYVFKNKQTHKICETIDNNLYNKNVILIDETIGSGNTINAAIDYLLDEKK